ncbi:ABC-2 type transporter [Beutenbergia cavernae DSM 12333]|uniref:Transport permease protein n=1 Tax=Beutenbergia cavernae (strain ATCC BAA-8 / DSM 12333 / CCUG 43141 / JCM 11478 / NBRC 16432 / NCIMB 13614 / HKI 0122) TaxID=471853 RepID=C5C331_BEUC1|nr:ABC transporter permease [Beutenbergia cavernae]ACQ81875.1 ABC-2 type transporter [Beutenbergia cavernae DSM 12333]
MIATSTRVLRQLRHDPRTIGMVLVVPCLLMTLLWWMFQDSPGGEQIFTAAAPALLAMFPLLIMFLITSVATLRERTTGTLERLLTLPLSRGGLIGGYALAFGLVAVVQAAAVSALLIGALDFDPAGPFFLLLGVAALDAVLGVALGLFVSAFARTEFQAVQFMPAILVPQLLLCGLFVPRGDLPPVLEVISNALPLSYAVDAITEVSTQAEPDILAQVGILAAFTVGVLVLGSLTLRRRSD